MKVIITGATGMVGKAVLIECIESNEVESVLLINRKSIGNTHSKVKEILHAEFNDLSTIKNKLSGFDACFFCMGVSSIGMDEANFLSITFNIVKQFADVLFEQNPRMVFNYVSGAGTDSTEKGNTMWARVKGKTENYILNKGFKDAYMFRAGAILPEKGVKSSTVWYNIIYVIAKPFFPLMKKSKNVTTSSLLGKAMINSVLKSQELKHLENVDINKLGKNSVSVS